MPYILKTGCYRYVWFLVIAVVISLLVPAITSAAMLSNFESGNLNTSTGGYFADYENDRTHGPDIQDLAVDMTQGAEGTHSSMRNTATQGCMYIIYYASATNRPIISEATNNNRLSFLIKLPNGYPLSSDNNFNVGTYTRDPINGDPFQLGNHYYHLLNITGSGNWTKVVLNQHPQHQVGVKVDPGNNPVSWGYYNGFTRFYFDLPQDAPNYPFVANIDEVQFYTVSEPENDETINSISCGYLGGGRFLIGWHGNSQYAHNGHRYQVRYSTSPITNANFSQAVIVPGSPFSLASGAYNWIKADFTISVNEGTRYYFAIKDIDSSSEYVSKIDYLVGDSQTSDNIAPLTPTNVEVRVLQ